MPFFLESVNRQPPHTRMLYERNTLGSFGVGDRNGHICGIFLLYGHITSESRVSREVSIVISLGIGLLILVVDKRQDRHLNEIIEAQHKMTNEIHKMIKEEIRLIKEMQGEKVRMTNL